MQPTAKEVFVASVMAQLRIEHARQDREMRASLADKPDLLAEYDAKMAAAKRQGLDS